ncbi:ubiquinone/menaquinone biosynthesis C-methylase UbiE [Luteococcus japonicus]|uniref:Ubiquinone/menaquinone biosynthesis C-methylase UbiE n=1 Tax=Luteococcus japonicus TaxID=33984 RepID=A0A3N1ZQ17_9ACTN|nr:class I SAM-dependent methyltransferase [Luteococcus japonicus]ROR52946.1 ubiquinone/menaquinone biosynthesis C-methylase UbiE [Luteococcus japonicus]
MNSTVSSTPQRPASSPPTREDLSDGFDQAAGRYDLMVALNPGYRRHLRTAAELLVASIEHPTPTLLDLGCGSGLSTLELLRAARRRGMTPQIIGVDASTGMLAQAERHRWPQGVTFVHGCGESLDELGLPPAHGALACYLLRNVTDLDATLAGIAAALGPGAPFVAEDYSVRGSADAQRRWHAVNRGVILPLAKVLTDDAGVYEYLHSSVDDFSTMPELADQLHRAGFSDVASRTVRGWQRDILHIIHASAPHEHRR